MKLASFEAVARALQDADVRYLVAGGLAVIAHGHLRVTGDMDIVIQLKPDNRIRQYGIKMLLPGTWPEGLVQG